MGLIGRLRAAYRALTLDQFQQFGLTVPAVQSGVTVTNSSALTIPAYWNGVNVIAGDIGVLDRFLYVRTGEEDNRERAIDHPTYRLVHDAPNPYMTSQVFWQTILAHALTWGGGYAEIEFDNALRPIALWPITPDRVEPKVEMLVDARGRKSTRVYYLVDGRTRLEAEDVVHIPGLGFDGVKGYSVVSILRETLGLSIAMERFGASWFGNGSFPGVALEHPGVLSPEAQANIVRSIEDRYRGVEKAHRLIVLEEGMKVSKPLTIPPGDSQFIEGRLLSIEDMARILNLPPHKLKHKMGERPGGNLETSQVEYTTGTLLPWTTRIEQELNRKLISPAQRKTHYVEHLYQKLLKTDGKTRAEIQRMYFDMGVLDAEQIARQENLPKPKPAPEPELPEPEPPEPVPEPPLDEGASRAARERAFRALALEQVSQHVRRDAARARAAAKKGPAAFGPWVEVYFGRGEQVFADAIRSLVAFRRHDGDGVNGGSTTDAAAVAAGYVRRAKAELLEIRAKDLAFGVDRLVSQWETTRAAELVESIMGAAVEMEESNA